MAHCYFKECENPPTQTLPCDNTKEDCPCKGMGFVFLCAEHRDKLVLTYKTWVTGDDERRRRLAERYLRDHPEL